VQESLAAVRDQAKAEAEDSLKAKVSEKEAQITGMQRQIEELRRKADQGSQPLQGEAFELALEALLRNRFSGETLSSPCREANSGVTSFTVCGTMSLRFVERCYGKPNPSKPGTIGGSRNCALTGAPPTPKLG